MKLGEVLVHVHGVVLQYHQVLSNTNEKQKSFIYVHHIYRTVRLLRVSEFCHILKSCIAS